MLTQNELNQIRTRVESGDEEVSKLVSEVDRLTRFVHNYSNSVSQKLDEIDLERNRLTEENARLAKSNRSAYIERDACIGVMVALAFEKGLRVGTAPGNLVILDLPSGQVSWEIGESESHLFSWLPVYPGVPDSIEGMAIEEKYRRVMNPGILPV